MGCDHRPPRPTGQRDHFNPRTRVGCDDISIQFRRNQPQFQSTHPRGVRPPCVGNHRGTFLFQSTHPRGVRPTHRHSRFPVLRFQSTHPRGVRPSTLTGSERSDCISIHAPAWGATPVLLQSKAGQYHFNPRTRVGCDWNT